MKGPAVVSLVPSVTETLLAWGVRPVAVTRFCEQPGLATVGGTKDPDVGAIVRLRPDLVVVDEEENRREDAEALAAAGLTLHVMAVRSLGDVTPQVAALRARLGLPPGPGLPPPPPPMPLGVRAFVPIWRRPWIGLGGGTYGSSLLATVGVANVLGEEAGRYPRVSLEEVAALRPHLVLAPSEPYPFGHRHVPELTAVAPVELVDGKDLFWWGVRTAPALRRLRARLASPAVGAAASTGDPRG